MQSDVYIAAGSVSCVQYPHHKNTRSGKQSTTYSRWKCKVIAEENQKDLWDITLDFE